jgi:hypothetical protein
LPVRLHSFVMNASQSAMPSSRKMPQVLANDRMRPARSGSAWYANAAKPDQTASLFLPADRCAFSVLIVLKRRRRSQPSFARISSREISSRMMVCALTVRFTLAMARQFQAFGAAPLCVTVNVLLAMVIVPLRDDIEGFAAAHGRARVDTPARSGITTSRPVLCWMKRIQAFGEIDVSLGQVPEIA